MARNGVTPESRRRQRTLGISVSQIGILKLRRLWVVLRFGLRSRPQFGRRCGLLQAPSLLNHNTRYLHIGERKQGKMERLTP